MANRVRLHCAFQGHHADNETLLADLCPAEFMLDSVQGTRWKGVKKCFWLAYYVMQNGDPIPKNIAKYATDAISVQTPECGKMLSFGAFENAEETTVVVKWEVTNCKCRCFFDGAGPGTFKFGIPFILVNDKDETESVMYHHESPDFSLTVFDASHIPFDGRYLSMVIAGSPNHEAKLALKKTEIETTCVWFCLGSLLLVIQPNKMYKISTEEVRRYIAMTGHDASKVELHSNSVWLNDDIVKCFDSFPPDPDHVTTMDTILNDTSTTEQDSEAKFLIEVFQKFVPGGAAEESGTEQLLVTPEMFSERQPVIRLVEF